MESLNEKIYNSSHRIKYGFPRNVGTSVLFCSRGNVWICSTEMRSIYLLSETKEVHVPSNRLPYTAPQVLESDPFENRVEIAERLGANNTQPPFLLKSVFLLVSVISWTRSNNTYNIIKHTHSIKIYQFSVWLYALFFFFILLNYCSSHNCKETEMKTIHFK